MVEFNAMHFCKNQTQPDVEASKYRNCTLLKNEMNMFLITGINLSVLFAVFFMIDLLMMFEL